MQCPIDNTTLLMSTRNNIEIDYCPQCRGVWLDRGELDKMINQSSTYDSRQTAPIENRRYDHDDYHHGKKKHKENFLSEIFDF